MARIEDAAGAAQTETVILSRRVVTPDGIRPAAIVLRGERIVALLDPAALGAGCQPIDVGEDVVMPGVVDTHVHINEPGRTEWEGFASATRAAAAGGVTTVVDMPLNSSPVTTSVAALEQKARAATGQAWVDYGFWGGVIPGNQKDLAALKAAGVLGFKCFMVDSGLAEFPPVGPEDLRRAMVEIAAMDSVLLAHAEAPGPIAAAAAAWEGADSSSYAAYLRSRPASAEEEAIQLLLASSAATGCRIHIVHLATDAALPALRQALAEGLKVSIETCPHYLCFAAEDLVDLGSVDLGSVDLGSVGLGSGVTLFKCAPPIRSSRVREGLWGALEEGILSLVASDHSPCPPSMKCLDSGDLRAAWGGISSLQLTLPALWSAARQRGFGLMELSRWLSREPARLAGLRGSKGEIAPGQDADLVIWKPEEAFTVGASPLHHRHAATPYAGRRLQGVVGSTWLRGKRIYQQLPEGGERWGSAPQGCWLRPRILASARTPNSNP